MKRKAVKRMKKMVEEKKGFFIKEERSWFFEYEKDNNFQRGRIYPSGNCYFFRSNKD